MDTAAWSVNTNTSIGVNQKVASSIPLGVSRSLWARHLAQLPMSWL